MRLNLVAVSYALWFLATMVLFYAAMGDDQSSLLEIGVVLGLIPAALQLLLLGYNPYGLTTPVQIALCFLLIALISYLGHAYWTSLIFFASLLFVFAIPILVASSPDERLLRRIAVCFSIPAAVFLLFVSITGEHVWGRLRAHGIEPDWWGLMGAGLAMAALAHRSRLLAALCIGVGFYVAYDASARSDMLAILGGLLAVGLLQLPALRGSRLVMAVVGALAALVLWMLFSSIITDTVTKAVTDTMLLDDPSRGLGTGLTGRTEHWEEAIRIWLTSPLFGVGFHQHTMFTSDHFPGHNVYLAILADTGIFGLIWFVFFVGASLYAALRIDEPRSRNAAIGTIVAYAIVGFFDSHGLSSGNPFSLYFEMCCFFALRQASLRRVMQTLPEALRPRAARPLDAT